MDTRLDPETVSLIFADCLADELTPPAKRVVAEGIVHRQIVFGADALARHSPTIEALLRQLPLEFHESVGGGMSFLFACNDRHGRQWTGEHRVMEQLFALGIAIGKAEYKTPRAQWRKLLGGMPYISVK